jgi:hypothetical protein
MDKDDASNPGRQGIKNLALLPIFGTVGVTPPSCTKRRWHPWFGRVVHIHEMIEQRADDMLHCSLDGDISRRWLELAKWTFDRATCLVIRMAASPRVDTAALIALKTCLADATVPVVWTGSGEE